MRITLLLLFMSMTGLYAQNFTISGYIKDAQSGETLIGASVYVKESNSGVSTNEYGFYSLSLPAGSYTLEYSYLGFSTSTTSLTLSGNIKKDIELEEEAETLTEVVVKSEAANRNVSNVEMSTNKLSMETIKKMPSLLGEVEIIRSIQLLPGVTTVGEGASGFNVRGGSIDQNLSLLDEAPIFNVSHLFGFFSVFNPDAVKDVKLYKGSIPARFGGRLSSILDVRMKEGNNKRFEMNGGIGFIFSRLSIEAPIVKDKASFIVAGRRSYADVLAQPFLQDGLEGSVLNFYDLTLKANYNISEKDRVFVSGYFGNDNFGFGEQAGFQWGNQTATFRWNHLFNSKLFSNLTAYYSNYDYEILFGEEETRQENSFDWNAQIVNYSLKPEFTYYISPNNILRFGGQGIIYEFEPGNAIGVSEGESINLSLDKKYAIESSAFIENELNFNNRLTLNYGLRYSHFNYVGEGRAYDYPEPTILDRSRLPTGFTEFDQWESIQTYSNLEPRAALKYQINDKSSVKASYSRTAQYLHLISNTTASIPLDVWTPSTNNIQPQTADQYAIGYFRNFNNNAYETSVELYYKDMYNIIEYTSDADLVLNEFLEGSLLPGDGRAYGAEFYVEKKEGRFTGWISYTLARTERQVEGINKGEWFPARFDQTHNLSITTFYELSNRLSLSANFVYNTGTPTTFHTSRFEQQGYVIPHNPLETRNNVRLPAYHRLDISATLDGKPDNPKRWKGQWVFSVYNLYNRRNAFDTFFRQTENRTQPGAQIPTEAVQLSVIGSFIPAVSYNFKF